MVIGETFAWGHLQKTGGDATWELFRLFPQLVEFADPRNIEDKHASFAERAEQVRGKLLVSNIRRLPTWTLSWAQHRARLSRRPDGRPVPMNSPHQMVEIPRADMRLGVPDRRRALPGRAVAAHGAPGRRLRGLRRGADRGDGRGPRRIAGFARVNALEYDHEVENWFTPSRWHGCTRSTRPGPRSSGRSTAICWCSADRLPAARVRDAN